MNLLKSYIPPLLTLMLAVVGCSGSETQQKPHTNTQKDPEVSTAHSEYVDLDKWELEWRDEFDYPNTMLDNDWTCVNLSALSNKDMLCSRWRENAVVEDGVIRLYMKKEERGGKSWTAASLYTKKTYQYGYYECRYKYAASKATNNSFWLMQAGSTPIPAGKAKIEIDINEGNYPNMVNLNIHNWSVDSKDPYYNDPTHHAFGNSNDVTIDIDTPVTCQKLRFSSNNGAKFHLKEFRAFDVDGKTNYVRDNNVSFTCSGTYNNNESSFGVSKIADNNENQGWVTQQDGSKWVVVDFGEERKIGSINFINGYKSGTAWIKTICDYNVEYFNGTKWVEIKSWDAKDEYDFSKEYHTCGLEWNEDELIYYFDGKELRRSKNVFCNTPVNVYLSLALLDTLGDLYDEDSGKYMEVDYVRIYKKK